MTAKAGFTGALNVQADGVGGSAGWNIRNSVSSVNTNLSRDAFEATTRANNGFKSRVPGLRDATATLTLPWDTADAFFGELINAWNTNTHLGIEVLDDAGASGTGLRADWYVTDFQRAEPIDNVMQAEITLVVAPISTATWITSGPSS